MTSSAVEGNDVITVFIPSESMRSYISHISENFGFLEAGEAISGMEKIFNFQHQGSTHEKPSLWEGEVNASSKTREEKEHEVNSVQDNQNNMYIAFR